jgi:lysozyme
MSDQAFGVDVSHYHTVTDWALLSANASFIGAKVSEGQNNVDHTFASHRDGFRSSGMAGAVYFHVARPGDPAAEAQRLASIVGPLQPNEKLALDLERSAGVTGVDWIDRFFDALPGGAGVLYASRASWAICCGASAPWARAKDTPLWIPEYGPILRGLPGPWSEYAIWQNSSSGQVPGVDCSNGGCDTDLFNGDLAALTAFFGGAPATT